MKTFHAVLVTMER